VNEPLLHVENVYLARRVRQIIADASFDLHRGELVALMGPSGSGKTTMLRTIAALETFDRGSIRLDGVTLRGGQRPSRDVLHALRRTVGLVFQFHHLFEHLTALRNVTLAPVHAHKVPLAEAERRAHALFDTLGIVHRANALPRELSGGEAQRVAIARALAVDPPLLMMDEPTASLDPERRAELAELLRGIVSEGRSILVSTHDEEFAHETASRVLRVSAGRIVVVT
jgi:ABC-type polar amino acid transport system ATPase subunit